MYATPKEAEAHYKVCEQTLREWANSGKIEYKRTAGGHRRYRIAEIKQGRDIVYARVSSKKQESDLARQCKYLTDRYPTHEVISDIGSGINYKRAGFRTILDQLFKRNIREVVVASNDRFSRFGASDFFAWIFEQFGGKLTILNSAAHESKQQELADELLEIVTVFAARHHGSRKYSNSEAEVLPKSNSA